MGPESALLKKVREEMQALDKITEECEDIAYNQKFIGNAEFEEYTATANITPVQVYKFLHTTLEQFDTTGNADNILLTLTMTVKNRQCKASCVASEKVMLLSTEAQTLLKQLVKKISG